MSTVTMSTFETSMQWMNENQQYRVVVNHEDQYSIVLAAQAIPPGWRDAGKSGHRSECLAYVGHVWTDMRPLSQREMLERR
jgi:MbtH protein